VLPSGAALGSIGTDGIDHSPAAGAVVIAADADIVGGADLIAKALAANDSYTLLAQKLPAAHLITGASGTNVADVALALALFAND